MGHQMCRARDQASVIKDLDLELDPDLANHVQHLKHFS
jgi:hypothetical protein